jgi:hypothetical protein
LDGIPRHLPALLRAEKLVKKARKAGLMPPARNGAKRGSAKIGQELLRWAAAAQAEGLSAEELLRSQTKELERKLRKIEAARA